MIIKKNLYFQYPVQLVRILLQTDEINARSLTVWKLSIQILRREIIAD